MSKLLCDEVISITEEYLGPAADRFIRRQVNFHLKKDADSLEAKDIPQLAEWIKVSLALLTEDRTMVDKCEKQIMTLAK
jgi:hypothetical protein